MAFYINLLEVKKLHSYFNDVTRNQTHGMITCQMATV